MATENGESKMEDYQTIQQIGKGPLGATFLLLHNSLNKKYVLKKIPLAKQSEKFKRTAHQEMMNLMTKLNHPYIVVVKDAWIDKGTHLCVVTDYCEGSDMTEIFKKARGKPFSEEKLCKWMTQMLLAVDYLHSNRVVHGNLKCSNIFLTKENDIRLGDFGLAKLLNTEDSPPSAMFNRRVLGTPPNFLCPELLENIPFGYKSDMWSLGCSMFEIAAHQPAFKAPDMAGLINKINRSLISPLPIVYSSTLRQIIKTMLRKTPEHRPTAADLLRHPHLQPYLLRCPNPAPVFLPVFPSPKEKPKTRRLSSSESTSSKDNTETDPTPKSLEKKFVKKVDFTSYSPSVSNHSDASSSRDIATCDLFAPPKIDGLSDESIPLNEENLENLEDMIGGDLDSNNLLEEEIAITSPKFETKEEESTNLADAKDSHQHEETITSPNFDTIEEERANVADAEGFQQHEEIIEVEYETEEKVQIFLDEMEKVKSEKPSDLSSLGDSSKQRADALESLLELCARLLKQDKLEELATVLKPFGEEAVSSRETAIWLTKSLIKYTST